MDNIFSKIDINDGDTVLVSSDILRILINNRNSKNVISPDKIIDMLKDKIGKNGNLLFPTFIGTFVRETIIIQNDRIILWYPFKHCFKKE